MKLLKLIHHMNNRGNVFNYLEKYEEALEWFNTFNS